MDEVDLILDAWRRELPEVDVSPLAILSRVTRLARHLDRARADAFAAHGLEVWEFDVLAALRRAGEPFEASPAELIVQTLSTSPTMTNRINRLAARDLVTREPNPVDARGVLVRLTVVGAELVDAALLDLLAVEERILTDMPAADRHRLAAQLRGLLAGFEQE